MEPAMNPVNRIFTKGYDGTPASCPTISLYIIYHFMCFVIDHNKCCKETN